jgi:hypothetical protein
MTMKSAILSLNIKLKPEKLISEFDGLPVKLRQALNMARGKIVYKN